MAKNIEIRNSTAEFLIFMLEGKEEGIQVMYKDCLLYTSGLSILLDACEDYMLNRNTAEKIISEVIDCLLYTSRCV